MKFREWLVIYSERGGSDSEFMECFPSVFREYFNRDPSPKEMAIAQRFALFYHWRGPWGDARWPITHEDCFHVTPKMIREGIKYYY